MHNTPKDTFTNYPQRTYDYDDLEDKLLNGVPEELPEMEEPVESKESDDTKVFMEKYLNRNKAN